jgi:hypothetical protein
MTRLDKLKTRITPEHMDLFKDTLHIVNAIDNEIDEHNRQVSILAIEGTKQDGDVERAYYNGLMKARDIVIDILEKTLEDFEHKGDKYYQKNFKDGVE